MADRPGEFDLIARYLAPLAKTCPGAFSLTDDAAVLAVTPGRDLVATKDAVVAGVHFLEDESPDVVAARALRVNLSDLAAMGAQPTVYLMALALPRSIDSAWIETFVGQLAADQEAYGIVLAGGDTVATPGPLMISITALGEVPHGMSLTRAGAAAGDRIFVSGAIGDAGLGLAALKGLLAEVPEKELRAAIERHRFPEPRLELGRRLLGLASAAIDVSDGLVADLGHICDASGRGAEIFAESVPLFDAVGAHIGVDPRRRAAALSAGDDYELLFTAPAASLNEIMAVSRLAGVAITDIGVVTEDAGVSVLAPGGKPMSFDTRGYAHF